MKVSTFLLIIVFVMHFISLTNITIFDGEWNGIVLAANGALLVVSLAVYFGKKDDNQLNLKS